MILFLFVAVVRSSVIAVLGGIVRREFLVSHNNGRIFFFILFGTERSVQAKDRKQQYRQRQLVSSSNKSTAEPHRCKKATKSSFFLPFLGGWRRCGTRRRCWARKGNDGLSISRTCVPFGLGVTRGR
jgi:hypothetical protein